MQRTSRYETMLKSILAVFLMALTLAGCASRGASFNDTHARAFVLGETTRDQAINALGPPSLELVRDDGLTILRWERQHFGFSGLVRRVVSANFRNDRMVYLHAPEKDEEVSVF